MAIRPIPLIILGGSDRTATRLPKAGADKHPLTGFKGVDVRIDGRPMIEHVIDSTSRTGAFDPIYIAGPETYYAGVPGASVIDTNASFGGNIQASTEAVRSAHPGSPIAYITCDVVPEAGSLATLMARYRASAPCDAWFPLIKAPDDREELGASSWKPAYRVSAEQGEPPTRILPGHLMVIDPEAFRLKFAYRLFELAYSSRNRSIDRRRGILVRGVIVELVLQDFRHLFSLRMPNLTWSVLAAGLPAGAKLRSGTITRRQLEGALRKIFVTYRHRRRYPHRRILTPVVDALALALDIDTEEEARERGGHLGAS